MKSLRILLALFASTFPPLNAADLSDLTYEIANGEASITDCDTAASGTLIIPDTIEGNPVTSIGKDAFRNCPSLTSINIPDSLTSIPKNPFYLCPALSKIEVGSENINFSSSNGVLFNADMTLLLKYPLGKTDTNYNIPEGVISIDRAFNRCTSLTSITIPESVTTIGTFAFAACISLTSITIPDSVTSIGYAAFGGSTGLTSITIPDGVTSINEGAFRNCTSLTSITISDSITSIGNSTFYRCTSLTGITIPDGVTSIGNSAFEDCTSLTNITFLGTAPTVGDDVFSGVKDGAIAVVTIESQASFGDLGTDWNSLTVSMSVSDMITALNAQNVAVATARMAGQGDVTSDPASYGLVTQASYNAVVVERNDAIVERDARPTIEEVKDARLGSVMLQSDVANQSVKIRFSIEETDDFRTWIKRDEINEITVPLEVGKRFYRFALEDE